MEVLLEDIKTPEKGYKIERFEMDTPYKSDEKLFGFIIYSLKFKDYLKPIIDHPSAGAYLTKPQIGSRNILLERINFYLMKDTQLFCQSITQLYLEKEL